MAAFLSQKPNANRQIDREPTTTSPPIYPFLLFSFSSFLSSSPSKRKQLQQPNSGNHVFYNAPNVRVANKGDCGINRQLVEERGVCKEGGKGRGSLGDLHVVLLWAWGTQRSEPLQRQQLLRFRLATG